SVHHLTLPSRACEGELDFGPGTQRSEKQPDLSGFLRDAVNANGLFGRTRLHLAGRDVELRAVPQTLNGAAHHDTACQRPAFVRAAIVESHVSALCPCEDDPAIADAQQLHLINLQLIAL